MCIAARSLIRSGNAERMRRIERHLVIGAGALPVALPDAAAALRAALVARSLGRRRDSPDASTEAV